MKLINEAPKAPRWISTEAGQWAWTEYGEWRDTATNAMLVHERQELLAKAEQLREAFESTRAAA